MQAALTDLRVSSRAETKTSSLRKATPPLVMGPGTFGCKGFVEFHAVLTCCIGGFRVANGRARTEGRVLHRPKPTPTLVLRRPG